MVVIAILLACLLTTATGFIVYQWRELHEADERIETLLAENEEQAAEHAAEDAAVRLVLDLTVRQNANLSRNLNSREICLLLVLEELERVS